VNTTTLNSLTNIVHESSECNDFEFTASLECDTLYFLKVIHFMRLLQGDHLSGTPGNVGF